VLYGLTNAIGGESREQLTSWNAHAEETPRQDIIGETNSRDGKDLQKHTEIPLRASLLDVASDLERRAGLNFVLDTSASICRWEIFPFGTIVEPKGTVPRLD
jgi:hypothetical protein